MSARPMLLFQPRSGAVPRTQPNLLVPFRAGELQDLAQRAYHPGPGREAVRTAWTVPEHRLFDVIQRWDVCNPDPDGYLFTQWSASMNLLLSAVHVDRAIDLPEQPVRPVVDGLVISLRSATDDGRLAPALELSAAFGVAPALAQTDTELADAIDRLAREHGLHPLRALLREYHQGKRTTFFGRPLRHFFPDRLPTAALARILAMDDPTIREDAILALGHTSTRGWTP